MTEKFIDLIQSAEGMALVWGPFIIFFLMAVESSLIPFPSEVVMIPAGIIVARSATLESWWASPVGMGLAIAICCGLAGSLAGAYFNYYLSMWLGRPFLYKYGKYFFLKPAALERSEEIFREYGDIATFVCRLLPAIRQLISIPAGLSRMSLGRFTAFTGLGAGLWVIVLTVMGYALGSASADKSYAELVHQGKDMLKHNLIWLVLGLAVLAGVYVWVHKKVMHSSAKPSPAGDTK